MKATSGLIDTPPIHRIGGVLQSMRRGAILRSVAHSPHRLLCAALFWLIASAAFCSEAQLPPRQKQFVDELRNLLPKSEPWENWIANSQASLPDLDELPS